ncbi:Nitrate/nitrite transporter NarK [Williamsia sterculiae]|uniref:Nitrate/nitrite transporter NarK n=2 Tax=Williamsia sterculiae TaxID=1344003 RepID=A0A1N7G4M1_9NOCA|nr:Nitrate/nitrite transporter NarK [Williamsia sterculiae]
MSVTEVSARRRWSMLACSLVAAMTTTCAVNGIAFLIPALHRDAGLSLAQASTLAAIPTVGLMISIIPWGTLLDRFGERSVLIVSVSLTLLATAGALVAAMCDAGYPLLGVLLFAGGLSSGAANGASGRIVVGWFRPEQRGTAMGIRQMAQPLGIGVCALTMPAAAQGHGVAAGLAVPVVVSAIGLLVTVVGIIDPPRPQPGGTDDDIRWNPYRASSFLARIHAVSVLLVIPQSVMWTFVPTWLIVGHGWHPATAGILVTCTQVLGAFGRIAAGRISDVWGSRMRPIRVIAGAAACGMALLALTDWLHSPVAAAVMVLASVATVADNGLAFTAIAEYAGPGWSGRGLGVQNTAQYLATAGTTPLFGVMVGSIGFPGSFAAAAITPLIALPLIPRDRSSEADRTVEAPTRS